MRETTDKNQTIARTHCPGILLQSKTADGIILLVQEGAVLTETNAYKVPISEIVIKLRQVTNIHSHDHNVLTVQIILVEPVKDVLEVKVKTSSNYHSSKRKLSSDSKSLIMELRQGKRIDLDGDGTIYRSYLFFIEVLNCKWRSSFNNITILNPDLVIKSHYKETVVDFPIKEVYLDKSAALKRQVVQKEDGTRVLEIKNYPHDVIKELVRFLLYDYCCLWDSNFTDLQSLAETYEIKKMSELAQQKLPLVE